MSLLLNFGLKHTADQSSIKSISINAFLRPDKQLITVQKASDYDPKRYLSQSEQHIINSQRVTNHLPICGMLFVRPIFFTFSPFHFSTFPTQVFKSDSAPETIFSVAIRTLELNQCLTVGSCFDCQSAVAPHPHDVIILGRKPF